MEPGDYTVIPCGFEPGKEVEGYVLEVHTSAALKYDQAGVEIADIDANLKDAKAAAIAARPTEPQVPFVPASECPR